MKLCVALAFIFSAYSASAAEFASCSGYHHGSYVSFLSADGKVSIEISNDGELEEGESWPVYEITSLEKDFEKATEAEDVLIKNVITSMASGEAFTNYVKVEATSKDGKKLYLNLNNYYGDSFLVLGGHVEPLTCKVAEAILFE